MSTRLSRGVTDASAAATSSARGSTNGATMATSKAVDAVVSPGLPPADEPQGVLADDSTCHPRHVVVTVLFEPELTRSDGAAAAQFHGGRTAASISPMIALAVSISRSTMSAGLHPGGTGPDGHVDRLAGRGREGQGFGHGPSGGKLRPQHRQVHVRSRERLRHGDQPPALSTAVRRCISSWSIAPPIRAIRFPPVIRPGSRSREPSPTSHRRPETSVGPPNATQSGTPAQRSVRSRMSRTDVGIRSATTMRIVGRRKTRTDPVGLEPRSESNRDLRITNALLYRLSYLGARMRSP